MKGTGRPKTPRLRRRKAAQAQPEQLSAFERGKPPPLSERDIVLMKMKLRANKLKIQKEPPASLDKEVLP